MNPDVVAERLEGASTPEAAKAASRQIHTLRGVGYQLGGMTEQAAGATSAGAARTA